MKYIIYKFDINKYLYEKNILSKYWTNDNQAEMNIYYKNNTDFEKNTIFPSSNHEIPKETIFLSNSHVDIFTIKYIKPGILYIRPIKKHLRN